MPDGVKFEKFNIPVCEVSKNITTYLKENEQQEKLFGYTLGAFCEIAFYTYKAITRLVATDNKNKYVAQAWTLVRSIIEIYFSVVYLIDNPKENTRRYNLVTFRIIHDTYKKFLKEYQEYPANNKSPDDFKSMMISNGEYFGLSKDEMNRIDELEKNQREWPVPTRIMRRITSDEVKSFLQVILDNQYSICSDIAHGTGAAIAMHSYALALISEKAYPGKYESDAVVMAIEFLVLIYSEIQVVIDCGIKQKLKSIWGLLIEHNMECAVFLYERHKPYFEQE